MQLEKQRTLINLSGEIGTTYVSFVGVQETTDSQKKQALANIGLMFETCLLYTSRCV